MTELMRIEKNLNAGIPESMRVITWEYGTRENPLKTMYLVQSLADYSEEREPFWVTQSEWKTPRAAMKDCANWYLSN